MLNNKIHIEKIDDMYHLYTYFVDNLNITRAVDTILSEDELIEFKELLVSKNMGEM